MGAFDHQMFAAEGHSPLDTDDVKTRVQLTIGNNEYDGLPLLVHGYLQPDSAGNAAGFGSMAIVDPFPPPDLGSSMGGERENPDLPKWFENYSDEAKTRLIYPLSPLRPITFFMEEIYPHFKGMVLLDVSAMRWGRVPKLLEEAKTYVPECPRIAGPVASPDRALELVDLGADAVLLGAPWDSDYYGVGVDWEGLINHCTQICNVPLFVDCCETSRDIALAMHAGADICLTAPNMNGTTLEQIQHDLAVITALCGKKDVADLWNSHVISRPHRDK